MDGLANGNDYPLARRGRGRGQGAEGREQGQGVGGRGQGAGADGSGRVSLSRFAAQFALQKSQEILRFLCLRWATRILEALFTLIANMKENTTIIAGNCDFISRKP